MQEAAARQLGCAVEEVRIGRTPLGKPTLVGSGLALSVSHGGALTVVAIGLTGSLGIDVEPERVDISGWTLVRHVHTERKLERIERLPCYARSLAVLRTWVRKEALLKAAGHGLTLDPRLLELDPAGRPLRVPPELGNSTEWNVVDLEIEEHVAALASRGPVAYVMRREL